MILERIEHLLKRFMGLKFSQNVLNTYFVLNLLPMFLLREGGAKRELISLLSRARLKPMYHEYPLQEIVYTSVKENILTLPALLRAG